MKKHYFVQQGCDGDIEYIGKFKTYEDACLFYGDYIYENTYIYAESDLWLSKKEIKELING